MIHGTGEDNENDFLGTMAGLFYSRIYLNMMRMGLSCIQTEVASLFSRPV